MTTKEAKANRRSFDCGSRGKAARDFAQMDDNTLWGDRRSRRQEKPETQRWWIRKRALPKQGSCWFPKEKSLRRDRDDFRRINVDEAAVLATVLEADHAADLGEEGVVLAAADVCAGLQRCATLTDDDAATEDSLTAEYLNAKSLRV
jgi:hypothetical protein